MVCAARRRRRLKPRDRPPSKTNLEDGLRAWDYAAGRRRQHQNKSLRPGHDCCAVCLRLPMLSCEACGRVSYCSTRCRGRDWRAHAASCNILKRLPAESLDALAVEESFDFTRADLSSVEYLPTRLTNWRDPAAALALSFPLSVAHALGAFPEAMRCLEASGAIHLVGAAPPEAAAPAQWWARALERVLPRDKGVIVTLVGPQVPTATARADRGVVVATKRESYEAADLCAGALLVGFNMGLSDSSYDWAAALDAARRRRATVVFFSPTRLELGRDARALKKAGAALVSDAVWNPFHAPNWKQSGELANDVYRKHSWARCAVFE